MNIFKIAKGMFKYAFNTDYRFDYKASNGKCNKMQDEEYIKRLYKAKTGLTLNLDNPKLFNEKLNWIKLYDRNPRYTDMVDKYKAKKIIGDLIGDEYIIPTLAVWDNPDEIDFSSLPSQFVLKCNHNSGKGMYICKDKSQMNIEKVKKDLWDGFNEDYYHLYREWPYKNVKHKIIAEKYIEDDSGDLMDYKWFCFNGVPKLMYISNDNGEDPRTDFFDMDFNHMPIRMKDPNADVPPTKPALFEEMKELATKLSHGVPCLRVDFYNVNGKIYVGELTFFHNAGFSMITPAEWNKTLGDWIEI